MSMNHSQILQKFQYDGSRLATIKETCALIGRSYTSVDNDVKAGLLPPWVKMGGKLKSLPMNELAAIKAARVAGQSTEEIKELVASIVKARTERSKLLASQILNESEGGA